nr:hypothetical protein [Tanacetum cinerariifolium]
MDFKYNNKRVLLRGTHKSNLEWLSTKVSNKIVRKVEIHLIAMCVFPYSASTCMPVEAVTTDVHPALQQVIEEYEDVFAIPKELPPKRDHFYNIPLIEGDQPVNIRPYRHPPTQKDAIKDVKDKFPIPIIKELIDELHGSQLFTKLDLSQTVEDHVLHLKAVLEIMRHHKLFDKMSKCVFSTDKVEYLGHVISVKGVATDPSKVKVMSQWPVPTNLKQLRGFLGLTGYYRRFIQG